MNINAASQIILNNGYKSVSVQLSEKYANDATTIICNLQKSLESLKNDSKIYFAGDVTSGDCCVDKIAAERCNSELIIHFGHWCHCRYLPGIAKILHFYPEKQFNLAPLRNHLQEISSNGSIALLYDTCFHHLEHEFVKISESISNIIVYKCATEISQIPPEYMKFNRISPTDAVEKDCEIMVFLGDSDYINCNYPLVLKISLELRSNCLLNCVYSNGYIVENVDLKNKITLRRYMHIEKIKNSCRIGICTSTASLVYANELRNSLNKLVIAAGKECFSFIFGKLNVAKLENFANIDIFCFLICPEQILKYAEEANISEKTLNRKIVFPFELLVALGVIDWSDKYIFDFQKLLEICRNHKDSGKSNLSNLQSGELANKSNNIYNALISNNSRTFGGLESDYNSQIVPTITPGLFGTATSYTCMDSKDDSVKK